MHTICLANSKRYMPPECLMLEQQWSEKSDVWALAVCAWEVLAESNLPWAELSDDAEVTRRVCNGKYLEIAGSLPLAIDTDSFVHLFCLCAR